MMRGVTDPAMGRIRATRGGLSTLARRGGEAMAATARVGFRKRFEREALKQAEAQGRTLTPQQLDEAANALLRAHMLMMVEKRLEKRYAEAREDNLAVPELRLASRPGLAPDASMPDVSIDELMAEAERKVASDDPRDVRALQRVAQPLRLCIGCWLEMCPGEPFPSSASSILCPTHLSSYMEMAAPAMAASPPVVVKPKTRNAPRRQPERARGLNHRPLHESL